MRCAGGTCRHCNEIRRAETGACAVLAHLRVEFEQRGFASTSASAASPDVIDDARAYSVLRLLVRPLISDEVLLIDAPRIKVLQIERAKLRVDDFLQPSLVFLREQTLVAQ